VSRSSNAVARTLTGPGPACEVSRTARFPVVESLPLLELNRTVTGRLSALATSQEMVARSPARTVFGEALQAMVGGLGAPALPETVLDSVCDGVIAEEGETGGASLVSMTSTPSPTWMSS